LELPVSERKVGKIAITLKGDGGFGTGKGSNGGSVGEQEGSGEGVREEIQEGSGEEEDEDLKKLLVRKILTHNPPVQVQIITNGERPIVVKVKSLG